jgi:ATP-binding cassette, sub-family E, member 1
VIIVEHDLSILDFLSDYVCLLYGSPGNYGVVTLPASVRDGINHFMDGFIPTENMKFRDTPLSFNNTNKEEEEIKSIFSYQYPSMCKKLNDFELNVTGGDFSDSHIIVLFGENGTGKTTFIRMLAGHIVPENDIKIPQMNISYKPQKINPKFTGTVHQLLLKRIPEAFHHAQFKSDVLKPLRIQDLLERDVLTLSGGEIQRVAVTICLGSPADIYLIDEPSAYLDSEQRMNVSLVIKRFIRNTKKSAFVVEHDFIMATYLADSVIVFDGIASKSATASSPQPLITGINKFLKSLNITFRRDRNNLRPRINKLNGVLVIHNNL